MRPAFLLVEDDADDALLLRRALERFQRQVVMSWTTDVPSALEHLARPPLPFLILTDVNLPRRSGWDLLHRVRTLGRPVLVWTSLPTPEGAARARDLGAARYFGKPRDTAGYMGVASLIYGYLGD